MIDVIVHSSGRFVYVANQVSSDVSAFRIEQDGRLSPLPGSPFKSGAESVCVAIEPGGKFLYVPSKFSHNIWVFRIADDGTLRPIVNSPFAAGRGPNSAAFSAAPERSQDPSGQ
jgi:6-phosphogluconolactonase